MLFSINEWGRLRAVILGTVDGFAAGLFDVVVCQLVITIIGASDNRVNLLRRIRVNLRPEEAAFFHYATCHAEL